MFISERLRAAVFYTEGRVKGLEKVRGEGFQGLAPFQRITHQDRSVGSLLQRRSRSGCPHLVKDPAGVTEACVDPLSAGASLNEHAVPSST